MNIHTLPQLFHRLFLLLRLSLKNNLFLIEKLGQVTILVHRHKNIRTTDEILLDVELRNRRPIGVLLDTLSQLRVLENIKGGELFGVDALKAEDLDGGARKAALGCLGGSLHEEDDGGG
jgi:hypothetical protein